MRKKKAAQTAGVGKALSNLKSLRPTLQKPSLKEAPSLMNKGRGVRVRQK